MTMSKHATTVLGVTDKTAFDVMKVSDPKTIKTASGCFLFVPKVLLLPSLFLSLSFKFVFVVLVGINYYHFLSSRCIVGSELAGITCFYKVVYPRWGIIGAKQICR